MRRRNTAVLVTAYCLSSCAWAAGVSAQVRSASVVSRLDHLMIFTPAHDGLVALLRDTLMLPQVWPAPGTAFEFSTGLALGDVNLEFLPRPNAPTTRFGNLAFQSASFADARAHSRVLGLTPLDADTVTGPLPRWTIVAFRLGHAGPGFFLIQYHEFDMAARRDRFVEALRQRAGGPLGLARIREVRISYDSLHLPRARESWRRLLALDQVPADDLFRPPAGPWVRLRQADQVPDNSLLVEVRDLGVATRAADALGLVGAATPDSVVLSATRLGGLRLILVAR